MKSKVLSHVMTFAAAVAIGLLMLASPAKATPATGSTCAFCGHSMGQAFDIGARGGPFSKMIDSRFRLDGNDQDGSKFFDGGDTVIRIKVFEDANDQGDQDAQGNQNDQGDKNDQGGTPDAPTPEPGTLLLLATGLTGLAFLVRRDS